jgi:hypothetical protein
VSKTAVPKYSSHSICGKVKSFEIKKKKIFFNYENIPFLPQINLNHNFMKKFTLLMISLSLFALMSCNKTYTCECFITQSYPPELGEEPVISTISSDFEAKNTRKAKAACESETTQTFAGMTQKAVCKLK